MTETLLLVKHSLPEIEPQVPASRWQLSGEGRRRCLDLADRLTAYQPGGLIASQEPKAAETARLAGAALRLPVITFPGLHEHERETVPFGPLEQFQADVARFFARSAERVYGEESADHARERFTRAVHAALAVHLFPNPVIVAHGTVISLFVAQAAGLEPFPLWQKLGLPSIVALSRNTLDVIEIIPEI